MNQRSCWDAAWVVRLHVHSLVGEAEGRTAGRNCTVEPLAAAAGSWVLRRIRGPRQVAGRTHVDWVADSSVGAVARLHTPIAALAVAPVVAEAAAARVVYSLCGQRAQQAVAVGGTVQPSRLLQHDRSGRVQCPRDSGLRNELAVVTAPRYYLDVQDEHH